MACGDVATAHINFLCLKLPRCEHNRGKAQTIAFTLRDGARPIDQVRPRLLRNHSETYERLFDGFTILKNVPAQDKVINLSDIEREGHTLDVICEPIGLLPKSLGLDDGRLNETIQMQPRPHKPGTRWRGKIAIRTETSCVTQGFSTHSLHPEDISDDERNILRAEAADILEVVNRVIASSQALVSKRLNFKANGSTLPFLEDYEHNIEEKLEIAFKQLDILKTGFIVTCLWLKNPTEVGLSRKLSDITNEVMALRNRLEEVLQLTFGKKTRKYDYELDEADHSDPSHPLSQWGDHEWQRIRNIRQPSLCQIPASDGYLEYTTGAVWFQPSLLHRTNYGQHNVIASNVHLTSSPSTEDTSLLQAKSVRARKSVRKITSTPSIPLTMAATTTDSKMKMRLYETIGDYSVRNERNRSIADEQPKRNRMSLLQELWHMDRIKAGAASHRLSGKTNFYTEKMQCILNQARRESGLSCSSSVPDPASRPTIPKSTGRKLTDWTTVKETEGHLAARRNDDSGHHSVVRHHSLFKQTKGSVVATVDLQQQSAKTKTFQSVRGWWQKNGPRRSRVCPLCQEHIYADLDTHQYWTIHSSKEPWQIERWILREMWTTGEKVRIRDVVVHLFHYLVQTGKSIVYLCLICSGQYKECLESLLTMASRHGVLQRRETLLEIISSPMMLTEMSDVATQLIARSLLQMAPTWKDRQELVLFLTLQMSKPFKPSTEQPEFKDFAIEKEIKNPPDIFLVNYIRTTVEEAVHDLQAGQEDEPLAYLTNLFWLMSVEVLKWPDNDQAEETAIEQVQPTLANFLLHHLIAVVDSLEADGAPNTLAFLRVFYSHVKFKETLSSLCRFLAANRRDTADRRTDRMRRYLAALPQDEKKVCSSTESMNEVDGETDGNSSRKAEVIASPLDEVLPLQESKLSGSMASARAISLEWLRTAIMGDNGGMKIGIDTAPIRSASNSLLSSMATLFSSVNVENSRLKFLETEELRIRRRLEETKTLQREDLLPRVRWSAYPGTSFPLPTKPSLYFKGIDIHSSSVIRSSKYPLVLSCETSHKSGEDQSTIKLMFKADEDLRQDALVTGLFKYFEDQIFSCVYDFPTYLYRYQVLPMSSNEGIIEFVSGSVSMSNLRGSNSHQTLRSIICNGNENTEGCGGISSEGDKRAFNHFLSSCAAYSVMTYVLAVGDRHQDNLMVDQSGKFFHVDYGYILGNDPKPFATVPMKLTREMVDCLGGWTSESYRQFCIECVRVFYILRKHHKVLESLMACTFTSQIADVQRLRLLLRTNAAMATSSSLTTFAPAPMKENVLTKLRREFHIFVAKTTERLRLDLDDGEVINHLIKDVVDVSVRSIFPLFVDKLHDWALYWR